MTAVAQFPSYRKTVRGMQNPLDKATIVSIFPQELNEIKPTITPGVFHVDAGSYERPATLVVGSSSWWYDKDEDSPLIEIPIASVLVANSIVQDYANGLLACDMADAMPGLFFLPGEVTSEEIKAKHKKQLDLIRDKQNNWFQALVRMADSLWARTNGNPLSVSDTMRMAARQLALEKDWLVNTARIETSRCVACGSMRNPSYPVCPTCRNIDTELAKKMNLSFVESK